VIPTIHNVKHTPPASLAGDAGTTSVVWVEARHFFSREDARENGWLWLLGDDGCVQALRLNAERLGDDRLVQTLRAQAGLTTRATRISEDGGMASLAQAPVVPTPQWTVSWGHPLQHAIRAFAARLDVRILDVLGWLEAPGGFLGTVQNYNRLAVLAEPVRQHRLQALLRFPALVTPLLLAVGNHPEMWGRDASAQPEASCQARASAAAVLDAMDRGRDLTGALATHHRISRALVRSPLLGKPWRAGRVSVEVLRLIDAITPEARPQNPADVEDRLDALAQLPVHQRNETAKAHLAGAFANGWNLIWTQLEACAPYRLHQAWRDCTDFLRAALRDGALPGKLRNLDEASLGLAWIARRGLLSLLRASLRWHARPLVQVVIEDDLPDTLPALLGELTFAKDGSAQELASREAVIAEGQRMRHCVGSYWEYCVLEGMRIFHLVDANANTATAAFAQSGPAPTLGFSLEQLNGPSNQAVGAPLKTLAQRVLAALNDDALRQARRDASEEAFRQAEHEAARRENRPVMAQPTLDRSLRRELRLVLDWSIRQAHWLIGPRRLYAGHIAGFNYTEGPHLRQQLAMGDSLILVREPDNPHDERAVRIDWQGHKLGYIPRAENAEIARRLDAGDAMAACITMVRSESARWAEVLVDVWMAA
jgi:hypothetical protein